MKRPLDPRIADDDAELFRAAVSDAVPLRAASRHRHAVAPQPTVAVQSLLDEQEALAESHTGLADADPDTDDDAPYLRPGLSRMVLRKLRRGHWVVQGQLDLHGMTRAEAREAVSEFLRESVRHAQRCVRIVHGKGLGSKNRGPVLKGKVRHWLVQRADVLAFCQAPAAQGGSGAVLVLLKG
jgi:DNA-nicking Smr family endonuclease